MYFALVEIQCFVSGVVHFCSLLTFKYQIVSGEIRYSGHGNSSHALVSTIFRVSSESPHRHEACVPSPIDRVVPRHVTKSSHQTSSTTVFILAKLPKATLTISINIPLLPRSSFRPSLELIAMSAGKQLLSHDFVNILVLITLSLKLCKTCHWIVPLATEISRSYQ
jgi:hypothetical protein